MWNRIATLAVIAAVTLPQTATAKWDPAFSSRDHELNTAASRVAASDPSAIATHSPVQSQMRSDVKPPHDPAYSSRDYELSRGSNRLAR